MTRKKWLCIEQAWLSGFLMAIGIAMMIDGFVLWAIYLPLSVLMGVLAVQNIQPEPTR